MHILVNICYIRKLFQLHHARALLSVKPSGFFYVFVFRLFFVLIFAWLLFLLHALCRLVARTVKNTAKVSSFVSRFWRGSCSTMCCSIRRCGFIRRRMCRPVCTRIWPPSSWATRKSTVTFDASALFYKRCTHWSFTIGLLIRVPKAVLFQKD